MRLRAAASALLVALAAAGTARATPIERGRLTLDINTTCVHTRTYARDHLNQVNPGLGLTNQVTPDWSVSIGFYRNSFRRTSGYALVNWTPLHLSLPAGVRVSAGLTAGLLSGYTHDENPVRPLAAGALVQLRLPSGFGVNLVGVPNTPHGSSGFIGLQLVAPF